MLLLVQSTKCSHNCLVVYSCDGIDQRIMIFMIQLGDPVSCFVRLKQMGNDERIAKYGDTMMTP